MSYTRFVVLSCDHGGCREVFMDESKPNVGEARRAALQVGWSVARRSIGGAMIDYCAAHATYAQRGETYGQRLTPEEEAGVRWALLGAEGRIPAGAFPRWSDPSCRHEPERQGRHARGSVCLDCGRTRVIAKAG